MKKVWLLKHPVSAEKKAEARVLKVKIVDVLFAELYDKEQVYTPKKVVKNKD